MLRCRLPAIRSLLHSRSPLVSSSASDRVPWRPSARSYGTALEEGRKDEPPPPHELDLSKVTAESSYLDFILGPKDGELPDPAPQTPASHDEDQTQELVHRPAASSRRTRKERLSQMKVSQRKGTTEREPHHAKQPQLSAAGPKYATFRKTRSSTPRLTYEMRRKIRACQSAFKVLMAARARGVRVRTKHVPIRSVGGLSGGFSSTWNIQFARIQRYYDKKFREYKSSRMAPQLDRNAGQWAEEVLSGSERDISMALSRLSGFTIRKRHHFWTQIALWLLHNDPKQMIAFLRGTHVWPYAPIACVDDSLRYLATHFSHENDVEQLQSLAELFTFLANRENGGRLVIDGSFLYLLMPHCSHEQINEMYRAVKVHNVKVDWNAYLRFTTYFAKNGHFEQALDALLEAKNANAALDSFAFRSNCATLLRYSIRQPAGLRVCLRLVDNLVKIGVNLNDQLCGIVMLNAVEAGDLRTAFSIYESLVDHGLEPNSYTYAILLKGCKSAIDDAETLNFVIRSAIEHVNVTHEPVVATEILHCLALHHKKHNPESAFSTVSDAFVQLFDTAPLEQFGVMPTRTSQTKHTASEKMAPPVQAIGIMLSMYMDHAFAQAESDYHAHELYNRFRSFVDRGLEPFVSMTETDYIPNCFLMTFIRSKKGLLLAAEVIKHMQQDSLRQCKPTQQSWSIFLHGFSRHGQMKLAEQVLKYMRGKGIEPNQVTWNTLATGYASTQDVEGTLDTLRRMELDSVTWNEWTINGLRKLQDQDRLRSELEKRRRIPQLDFTSDIKDGLGQRLNAFGEAPTRMERRRIDVPEGTTADSPSDLAESGAQTYTPFQ